MIEQFKSEHFERVKKSTVLIERETVSDFSVLL